MELDTSIIQQRYPTSRSRQEIVLEVIVKILIGVVVTLFILSWIFVSVTILGKVSGSSMENTLYNGDYLLLHKKPKSVTVGDIVILPMPNEDLDIIKRVVAIQNEYIRFVTEQDNPQTSQNESAFVYLQKWNGQQWGIDSTNLHEIEQYKNDNKDKESWQTVVESSYIKEPMLSSFFSANNIAVGMIDLEGKYHPSLTYIAEQNLRVDEATVIIKKGFVYCMGDNRNNSRDSRQAGQMRANTILGKSYYQLRHGSFVEWFFKFLYREKE